MRIRSLVLVTLSIATLTVLALTTASLTTGLKLTNLSRTQEWSQTVSHEISSLLVLTHEYALHAEPRAAQQWHIRLDGLLKTLAEQHPVPVSTIEQVHSLDDLFSRLVANKGNTTAQFKQERTEILLDQLLTNTQSLSDQFHDLSVDNYARRAQTENDFKYTSLLAPFFSLVTLLFTFYLLATRVLRPLNTMRKAVNAVSEGDLSVRSDTGSNDELGELSRAFDSMALDLVTQLKQEIRERRQIEENLHRIVAERTASLKTIFDTAADSIITTDMTGVILSVNQATERLFGYSTNELIGQNVTTLMPMPHQNTHIGFMKSYLDTGKSNIVGKGRELEGLHKNGQILPIHISLSEMILSNEVRFTGILRDITLQKQTERELITARDEAESANRAKSEFLSSMSHELRTPMNAILGFGQLLGFEDTLSEQNRISVEEIMKAGRHLLELINEVLDLSRIESGHIDLIIEPVVACNVIEECVNLLARIADKRRIRINLHDCNHCVALVDRTRLKQILINLLTNAIKYNIEGGTVDIYVKRHDNDMLRIGIKDSGPGIPAERMNDLFIPFNRLGAERSNIEGTGIGLTITKRITEMMGGHVGVESEVGTGSTFWIDLPTDIAHESAQGDPLPADEKTDVITRTEVKTTQYTVLYIEDNPANLRLVTQIMGRRGHIRLLSAHTPELGIDLAQAYMPDLILLDINMPGMNGFQVLEILRADNSLKHISVIAVTADAMPQEIARGMKAGFSEYLTKPLDVMHFNNVIDKYLKKK